MKVIVERKKDLLVASEKAVDRPNSTVTNGNRCLSHRPTLYASDLVEEPVYETSCVGTGHANDSAKVVSGMPMIMPRWLSTMR